MHPRIIAIGTILPLLLGAGPLGAQSREGASTGAPVPPETALPVVTRHTAVIGGRQIEYDATVGAIVITDGADRPLGRMFYTAYTRRGVTDLVRRPIAFAYNGGPGSASVMLHVGALGPRRIVLADTARPGAPPYRIADNEFSVLDRTDLVFVDPVATGVSRLTGSGTAKDFFGVDEDARATAQFILKFLSRTNRWNSPRYLVGESYGTTRTAVVAGLLHRSELVTFNGLILVSAVLDRSTVRFGPGADLPYIMFLPSYAATARHHGALQPAPPALAPFLQEVERFATTEYALALLAGSALDPQRRAQVLDRLERYTGLDRDYLDRANLRVEPGQFQKELLRSRGVLLGRQDARFSGPVGNPLADRPSYDVSSTDLFPAFLSLFNHYLRGELGYATEARYVFHEYDLPAWNMTRTGGPDPRAPPGNVMLDLADVLLRSPRTKVLLVSGIYDLATPYFGARWTMDHLGLPPEIRSHIHESLHESGHAMYVHEPSLAKLKRDLAEFIEMTSPGG